MVACDQGMAVCRTAFDQKLITADHQIFYERAFFFGASALMRWISSAFQATGSPVMSWSEVLKIMEALSPGASMQLILPTLLASSLKSRPRSFSHGIFKISVPIRIRIKDTCGKTQIQRRRVFIGLDFNKPLLQVLGIKCPVRVFVKKLMVIAADEKRSQFEEERFFAVIGILDYGGVAAVPHKNRLGKRMLTAGKNAGGQGHPAEGGEVLKSLRMNGAWIGIGRCIKFFARRDDFLFHFRDQHASVRWWIARGDEESMISACIRAADGGGSISSDAVGDDPFRIGYRFVIRLVKLECSGQW